MKNNQTVSTNPVIEKFMDLFLLELTFDNILSISNAAETIQICLEPESYEDVSMIKNMQEYMMQAVMTKEERPVTFQEELSNYMKQQLNAGMLIWEEHQIAQKWKCYSKQEKERMADFMEVFHGVYDYVENRNEMLDTAKQR